MRDNVTPTDPTQGGRWLGVLSNPRWLRLALYAAAAITITLFMLALAVPLTANPKVCGFCHSMETNVDAWKKSSHARITCAACHVDPSVGSLFNQHLVDSAKELYAEMTGQYEEPLNPESDLGNKTMSLDACLRCHSPSTRRITPRQGLTMDSEAHLKHLDAELTCTVCHNRVAHLQPDGKYSYLDGMDMFDGCLRCHVNSKPYVAANGKQAPTTCNTCHTDDAPKPDSHLNVADGRQWIDKHGPIARQDINYCQRCHSSDNTEATGIPSCYSCHGVVVPHQDSWRQEHPKSAKGLEDKCRRCHKGEDRDFCQQCHHGKFNIKGVWVAPVPGVSQHPEAVRQQGVGVCLTHHTPVFCPKCHIRGPEQYQQYQETYMRKERG